MTPRPLFPKARPTKAAPRKKSAKAAVHVFVWDASSDWRGQPLCQVCDQPRNLPVHDLRPNPEASEIDQRKLGELKRDDPELAEKVVSGEISAYAAARTKGWKPPRIQVTTPERTAAHLRQHMKPGDVATLARLLQEG